jgi:DHA1 family bicyclomycin/chloramphenicol resistance-like MFS transporter
MSMSRSLFALVAASTVVGLMGTDLVLPAIPALPEALGGSAAEAQFVLAAYAAGLCVGLVGFGALSDHVPTARLFLFSLAAMAIVSFACTMVSSLPTLVALRALQGTAAAGPAVFAPPILKALFDEQRAVRALGLLGSLEALAPAVAPVAGVAILARGGWPASFELLAVVAGVLAVLLLLAPTLPQVGRRPDGSYRRLMSNAIFLRYAISQALVLGGLLVFVFGMPAMFVRVTGGTLQDFIVMQITAILFFIVASNLSERVVDRYGAEAVIALGTALAASGAAAILFYALTGGTAPLVVTLLFIPVNVGLGLRGPPGFYRAVAAANGDDARGSALVVLGVFGVTALGTAIASPWIEWGLWPLAAIALIIHLLAVAVLRFVPPLPSIPK